MWQTTVKIIWSLLWLKPYPTAATSRPNKERGYAGFATAQLRTTADGATQNAGMDGKQSNKEDPLPQKR